VVRLELIKARDCYSNLAVLLAENRNMLTDIGYLGMMRHDQIEPFLKECIMQRCLASNCMLLWFDKLCTCFRYQKSGQQANLTPKFIQLILESDSVTTIDF
jgi:hypothetical protein